MINEVNYHYTSVKSGDYQAAVDSFEKSLDMARAQGDAEAEKAIKKALQDVNDKIVHGLRGEDGSDGEKGLFMCTLIFI